LNRSLVISEEHDDAFGQLQALGPLEMFHIRTGEFKTALHYAKRCSVVAGTLRDPIAVTLAHSLMGISLHICGELDSARLELESALRDRPGSQRTTTIYVGFDSKILAGAVLASTLWLQGYPVQAMERARQTVEEAASMNHPLSLSLALIWAIYVFFWTGDLQSADEHIERLISCAESHSFAPYSAVGRGFSGELAIRRGDAKRGIESLRATLDQFHATPYEVQSTPFTASLAQGLAAIGQFSDANALIDETIQKVEVNGDYCYMPELLRLKGGFLLAKPQRSDGEAEVYFRRSLGWSRRQGARSLELRAANDLAKLLADHGRPEDARSLLQPVFEQFMEGLDTSDLRATERLLASLP
jgi:predicted ATPase